VTQLLVNHFVLNSLGGRTDDSPKYEVDKTPSTELWHI